MYRWRHRKDSLSESTARAEVSAWLEDVGDELDQSEAGHEVERGLNVYSKTRAADQLGLESSLEAYPTPAGNESG